MKLALSDKLGCTEPERLTELITAVSDIKGFVKRTRRSLLFWLRVEKCAQGFHFDSYFAPPLIAQSACGGHRVR